MSTTKEELEKLNYECILISILVENEDVKTKMKNSGLRLENLSCFCDRLDKINDYYNSQSEQEDIETDQEGDLKDYISRKAHSGDMKKDLAGMLSEIYRSLDEALSNRER